MEKTAPSFGARLAFVAVIACLLAASACQAPRDAQGEDGDRIQLTGPQPVAPSLAPIVIPNPGARGEGPGGRVLENRPVGEDDAGWSEKVALARGYVDGGFEEEARAVITAALAADPPSPWRERLESIRTTMRVRSLETQVLRIDAVSYRDYAAFGADLHFRVRIRNVSNARVVFPATETAPILRGKTATPTLVNLVIERRDLDIYGAELTRTWNETVYLVRPGGQGLEIPPGGVHEDTVRVAGDDVGEPISGLRIVELTGTLRGLLVHGGGTVRPVTLPVRAGRVVVLPDGYEPLAADPLGSMRTAVEAVAPTHLLVASEFVPRHQSDQAVEVLAGALAEGAPALRTAALGGLGLLRERNVGRPVSDFSAPLVERLSTHPERREALMEGLARATGQEVAPDPRLWAEWWRRARREGAVVPAPTPGAASSMARGRGRR